MRRALALDTTTWWAGLALLEQGAEGETPRVVAEELFEVRDSHAAHLPGCIEPLLARAGWSRSDPDVYVAVRGPGSFTGVRIGLGVVSGLALAADRPAVGVTSLEAMAEAHGPADGPRVPLLDAARGESYAARFDGGSSPPSVLRPPWLGTPREAVDDSPEGSLLICGAGLLEPLGELAAGSTLRVVPASRSIAVAAGRLALIRTIEEQSDTVVPLYLRASDAEIKSGRG